MELDAQTGVLSVMNRLASTPHFAEGVLPHRAVADARILEASDPALDAITDFTREYPATVDAERQIDDALNDMIRLGVRALLVLKDERIVGLITSYDVQGERPLQFLQSSNYRHHRDIRVSDIMTPWENLLTLNWDRMQMASAGELFHVFEETGLTHLIVIERDRENSAAIVRGLVSRTRLERQLKGLRRAG